MNKKISCRVSAVLLYLHGLIEVAALYILHPVGADYIRDLAGEAIGGHAYFYALTGVIWGVARIIAGTGILYMKKWAALLGIILSSATLIVAMSLVPFGLADLLLAVPVLVMLLYVCYLNDSI